jgi:hypothetical protein
LDHETERTPFTSRFEGGRLVTLDYDAFHLRLIARLIDYRVGDESFHEHMAKLYYGKDEVSEAEYKEAKTLSFHLIYNPYGIPEELLEIDYFREVKELTDKIWQVYERYGVIQTPFFGRQISGKHVKNFNPSKAINYVLQAFETEWNTIMLKRVYKKLEGKKTLPVLYTYDSVLLDFHPEEFDLLPQVRDAMETRGMKVKAYSGVSLDDMKRLASVSMENPDIGELL